LRSLGRLGRGRRSKGRLLCEDKDERMWTWNEPGRARKTAYLGRSDGSDCEPKTKDVDSNAIEFCLELGRLCFAFRDVCMYDTRRPTRPTLYYTRTSLEQQQQMKEIKNLSFSPEPTMSRVGRTEPKRISVDLGDTVPQMSRTALSLPAPLRSPQLNLLIDRPTCLTPLLKSQPANK
jgi:hypothetical protein